MRPLDVAAAVFLEQRFDDQLLDSGLLQGDFGAIGGDGRQHRYGHQNFAKESDAHLARLALASTWPALGNIPDWPTPVAR